MVLHSYSGLLSRHVDFYTDNTAVIACLASTHSKSYWLNLEVGRIIASLTAMNSTTSVRWVPSERNPTDGLSRGSRWSYSDQRKLQDLTTVVPPVGGGREAECLDSGKDYF